MIDPLFMNQFDSIRNCNGSRTRDINALFLYENLHFNMYYNVKAELYLLHNSNYFNEKVSFSYSLSKKSFLMCLVYFVCLLLEFIFTFY